MEFGCTCLDASTAGHSASAAACWLGDQCGCHEESAAVESPVASINFYPYVELNWPVIIKSTAAFGYQSIGVGTAPAGGVDSIVELAPDVGLRDIGTVRIDYAGNSIVECSHSNLNILANLKITHLWN